MYTVCGVFNIFRNRTPNRYRVLCVYERRGEVYRNEFRKLFYKHEHARHAFVQLYLSNSYDACLPFDCLSYGVYFSEEQLEKEIRAAYAVYIAYVDKFHVENNRA